MKEVRNEFAGTGSERPFGRRGENHPRNRLRPCRARSTLRNVDSILDEIDGVSNRTQRSSVRNFVQKGGQ
ncbi:ubiquitin-like protein Pup [Brevibacterium sp. UCMA 11754]|uniref:ubiquitin-like protein Pup n=1 Tax=Brevibacterium sp. UCMA 11754 TaxID=2749198 RepID=UPI001F3F02FB|nr:ubiquitin-like protein Pup [Brevibacterium sp. UCMA 11754]